MAFKELIQIWGISKHSSRIDLDGPHYRPEQSQKSTADFTVNFAPLVPDRYLMICRDILDS